VGAEIRSCSLSVVLVEQPAESVAPAHRTWLALAGDVQASRRIRRPQLQRPVRTMGVEVGGVDPEDLLEMAAPDDQQPVQAFSADRANPPFRVGVRVGRLHGVRSTSAPSDRNTSSKLRVNFASRSRRRKRTCRPWSPSTSMRLRACWATQPPSGLAVTPARCTRRMPSSMKNSTYSRRSQMVSTVKKSQARMPAACRRRNDRQVVEARRGAGSTPWARSTRRMELAEIWQPRRSSSPQIRW
jgi:hypothetical protein